MLNPLISPEGASTLPGNNAVPGTNPLPVAGQTPGAVTPASPRLKPEDILKDRYKAGQRTLQQEFQRGWDAINDQARNLGIPRVEHQRKLDDLHMQAQQKADAFNADTQRAIDQLKELDRLATSGLITNAEEAKWNLTVEPEVRKAMFPEEQSDMKKFADLDIYRGRLEGMLGGKGYFREVKPKKHWYSGKPVSEEPTLEIWDSQTGKYRPATSEEQNIGDEIHIVREKQNMLMGQPTSDIMKTALTSKRTSGGLRSFKGASAGMTYPYTPGKSTVIGDQVVGGSIGQQTTNYLQQKETGTPTTPNPPGPPRPTRGKTIYAKNPNTGQRIISTDGGETWQIVE